ncbi:hypothetical protein SAMN04488020_11127 [Palleronia marisminoris]|uniref:Uncharacterized protein n=1 Tax=Palleronia marisminoris TaxID=315423 RepID=A0A1Y5THW0_9RHOB|nr:hypothetical protein SAMN04488020_11127 [Palleronia marisminoris]SLN62425.1 hypothetical protein PAM7066_03102 [Palleronia marisminoris]
MMGRDRHDNGLRRIISRTTGWTRCPRRMSATSSGFTWFQSTAVVVSQREDPPKRISGQNHRVRHGCVRKCEVFFAASRRIGKTGSELPSAAPCMKVRNGPIATVSFTCACRLEGSAFCALPKFDQGAANGCSPPFMTASRVIAACRPGSPLRRYVAPASRQRRKSAFRRFCGKTPVRERRILALVIGAGAFLVRHFAVPAVREGSSPVSGGSGRWRRAGIRRSRRMVPVVGASQGRGYA